MHTTLTLIEPLIDATQKRKKNNSTQFYSSVHHEHTTYILIIVIMLHVFTLLKLVKISLYIKLYNKSWNDKHPSWFY